jgi:hypothetical protein
MKTRILKRLLSITVAFVVFGFIDNFLMILFGDQFDRAFVAFGISNTLLAAGLGNTLSDAVGIMSGRGVEKLVYLKLPTEDSGELSKNQIIVAETVGIIMGCLIGLSPLLFL